MSAEYGRAGQAMITSDIFSEIRERVSAEDAARFYGMEISQGKARCIFHSDKHPSLSFRGGRFRCWACGAAGSALDLTMQLFGLNVTEAARKLNEDFRLGLAIDRKPSPKEQQAARERLELAREHEAFESWCDGFITRLNTVYRRGHTALLSGQDLTGADAEAVRRMAQAEALADELTHGTPAQQAGIYRERRQIERWIEAVLQN